MDSLPEDAGGGPAAMLSRFRRNFHACLTARADELSELAAAVLCADGPVRNLAALSLAPEHGRGHGAAYDAVNYGRIGIVRLRRSLAGLPLPRAADGRLTLAVDVSNWLRPVRRPARTGFVLPPGRLTPARVRRGFRNIHATMACLAGAPKPGKPGPGRPPGSKNRWPAPRHDVGKTTKREPTLKAWRERAG